MTYVGWSQIWPSLYSHRICDGIEPPCIEITMPVIVVSDKHVQAFFLSPSTAQCSNCSHGLSIVLDIAESWGVKENTGEGGECGLYTRTMPVYEWHLSTGGFRCLGSGVPETSFLWILKDDWLCLCYQSVSTLFPGLSFHFAWSNRFPGSN